LPVPIFITGIGTGVGKTLVSAIVAETLEANYWKPIQAGYADGTDAEWVKSVLTNKLSIIYPELYKLALPASPHIAAREEGVRIELSAIKEYYERFIAHDFTAHNPDSQLPAPNLPAGRQGSGLIIEGAGGLLVPINGREFVADIIRSLQAKVILVSRNYLGSINHSLLTAVLCKQYNLDVIGWIFNDQFMQYEEEIVQWSGFPKIASIPKISNPDKKNIRKQATAIKDKLLTLL
jgi:dethiobiotin synthetase